MEPKKETEKRNAQIKYSIIRFYYAIEIRIINGKHDNILICEGYTNVNELIKYLINNNYHIKPS